MKNICINIMCSIYVFGSSAGPFCPVCGQEGLTMSEQEDDQFGEFYRSVKSP